MKDKQKTYKRAFAFVRENFNATKIGCLYYNVDYDTASKAELNNVANKMKQRLEKESIKTLNRLNEILFPMVVLLSDQELEAIQKAVERKKYLTE